MNTTITPFTTNATNTLFNFASEYPQECYSKGKYSIECFYKTICPQLNHHFITLGITIIIIYIVVSWFLWWYLNYGYKGFYIKPNSIIGDLNNLETRIYWDTWIRARLTTLCIGYIAMVVWLSMNVKI